MLHSTAWPEMNLQPLNQKSLPWCTIPSFTEVAKLRNCVISLYFFCHSVQYCTSCIVLFYVSICLELLVVWAFGEVTQFVKIPLAISSGFLTFADFWLTHVNLENAVKTVVWMHMCVILPTVKVQKDYATLTSVASRAFTVAAPTVWNSLSVNTWSADSFASFKRRLKTELFASTHAT